MMYKCDFNNTKAEKQPANAGLPLNFLSWAYVGLCQRIYFWAYGRPGVSIFRIFVQQAASLQIFRKILGLLDITKMYKLF